MAIGVCWETPGFSEKLEVCVGSNDTGYEGAALITPTFAGKLQVFLEKLEVCVVGCKDTGSDREDCRDRELNIT